MDPTALEQIRNFYLLDDNIATGGQPEPDQFAIIKDAGFDAVINLARVDSPGAVSNEGKLIRDLGMDYEHIPVDFKKPDQADLELFFHGMERHQGKKVFVHCAFNWRVSGFMFLYRTIRQHCPVDLAMRDLHAVWEPDGVWRDFIESTLDTYNLKL